MIDPGEDAEPLGLGGGESAHLQAEMMALIASTLHKHPHLVNATTEEVVDFLEAATGPDRSFPPGEAGCAEAGCPGAGCPEAGGVEDLLGRYRRLRGRSRHVGGGCALGQ